MGLKSTAWHVEALLQKFSDASHIQIVWKGLCGFRWLSWYSIFDLFNFTPVKILRTCRFQNVNVVYHSHHNAYISRFGTLRSLQNPMHMVKQMIPRDIPGILDFPGRWNYWRPICQFFPVCLRGAREAGSDISKAQPTYVLLTRKIRTSSRGEIAPWQFINILSRWQGQLKTLPPQTSKHTPALLSPTEITFTTKICCCFWVIRQVHKIEFERLTN